MYLISLYFDEKTNSILKRYIDKISKETGNAFMTDHEVPPHMTLSAIEARSADVLKPSFDSLKGRLEGGKIQFVSTGQLLPYVFYITPVLNDYLTGLSKTVYDEYSKIPKTAISRYYRPGSWLPHVTIGKTLTKEQMLIALKLMQDEFTPFKSEVTRIGLSRVNPHKDVCSIIL